MKINTIIVDNFLDNPDLVRKSVLELPFNATGPYPGLRSDRADAEYEEYIKNKLEKILNFKIKEFVQDSFRFQLCIEDVETWVHKDETDWAAVLYLTPNAPYSAGTGIYINEEDNYDLVTAIGNVYNRLAIYRGTLFHRSMQAGFGKDKETGRLTQVFFFNVEQNNE
jgi:hypothetical protein